MSEVQEYAARLSQVIGPRPAGTEEEQQASFYIEEILQQEAGLDVHTQEFNCNPNYELPRTICCIVTMVLGVLSIFLPVVLIPAVVVTLITAVLFILEVIGIQPLTRTAKKGVSQNIIGKYIPPAAQQGTQTNRRRKVILVAHYDTGKVRRELSGSISRALNVIHWIELAAMVIVPLSLIIRLVTSAEDTFLIVLNAITVIGVIGAFLPVMSYILRQTAKYNDGANCNASGVAVMAEVAKRVGLGLYEQDDQLEDDVMLHGEDAARDAGLIPPDTELVYERDASDFASGIMNGETAEGLPEAAGTEIADGVSGMPGAAPVTPGIASDNAVDFGQTTGISPIDMSANQEQWQAAAAGAAAGAGVSAASGVTGAAGAIGGTAAGVDGGDAVSPWAPTIQLSQPEDDNVPSWYKRARQNANKSATDSVPAQRSRFADALDNAEAISQAAAQQAEEQASPGLSEVEQRLAAMRASIMGTAAPTVAGTSAGADGKEAGEISAAPAGRQPQAGVGGFLSSTMASPDYATAKAAAENGIDIAATPETEQAAAVADRIMSYNPANSAAQTNANADATPATSAAASTAGAASGTSAGKDKRKKRSIALPSLTGAINAVNAEEVVADGASLGAGASASNQTAHNAAAGSHHPASSEADRHARQASLAASLPSLGDESSSDSKAGKVASSAGVAGASAASSAKTHSGKKTGATRAADSKKTSNAGTSAGATSSNDIVSQAGSFAVADATGAFNPVGDELVANMSIEDMYVDDADDSAYDEQFTESGAMAGPGYVDMPESRASRVFGRFRRNKKRQEEESLAQALGVDENFDARKVGKERGGWESFRNNSRDFSDDAWDDSDDWNGGAFSRERLGEMVSKVKPSGDRDGRDARGGRGAAGNSGRGGSGRQRMRVDYRDNAENEQFDDYAMEGEYDEMPIEEAAPEVSAPSAGRRNRDASGRILNPFGDLPLNYSVGDEREAIRDFHDGPVNMEVWFVAIGAELADNAGMKAFLNEYASELRGSMIIDLDAMGAGKLTMIEAEGCYRPAKMSSRMKRYVHKASSALGMSVGSGKMLWHNSAAYYATKRGFQTLHLAGMMDGKPARCGQADDTYDNLDLETLQQNADFTMELIRSI